MQHVKTISALRDMVKSDLTLQIESRGASDDSYQSTHISSANRPGLLHSQSQTFSVPAGYNLSNMKVYTAADKSLALNIFTFNKTTAPVEYAKREDAAPIFNYIKEVKEGKYANDPTVPAYSEMFTEKAMEEYINNISRSYAQHSHPRRFMVQRELYEMVKDNDSTAVHVEPHLKEPTTSEGYAQAMISIASANVLPEVLLRLCSGIVSAKHIDIQRAHLDIVKAPESSTPEMEGNVTMLRLLVTADSVRRYLNYAQFCSLFFLL